MAFLDDYEDSAWADLEEDWVWIRDKGWIHLMVGLEEKEDGLDAWSHGLKTTYYLRTLGASNIEKATIGAKKELRGVVAQSKHATSQEPEVCESCQ